jgi:NAD(P)-dependent dehydrogenase (short-subunit alcohol dehydrogenase family)
MSLLTRKSILITGGASGIGLAAAHLAAREGARVAICDRDAANGREAVESISAVGGEAVFLEMDVTDEAQVAAGIEACVRQFGRLDGAFNNAGISTEPGSGLPHKAGEIAESAWRRVLDVNLTGVWRCMRNELRQMLAQRGGASIVNNASVAGLVGLKGHSAYAATKHGVVGLTRSAAADYAHSGIRINAVCPGFVATPLTRPVFDKAGGRGLEGVPLRRLGTPQEVAEVVVWLLSDRASFITGLAMAADGGYTSL